MTIDTPGRRVRITPASEITASPRRRDWGPWKLGPETLVIYVTPYQNATARYEVGLDECTTSAQVLDWICQVAGKTWADTPTVAGLVRALDDVLHPQANLCSSGEHKTMTVTEIRRRVRRIASARERAAGGGAGR